MLKNKLMLCSRVDLGPAMSEKPCKKDASSDVERGLRDGEADVPSRFRLLSLLDHLGFGQH